MALTHPRKSLILCSTKCPKGLFPPPANPFFSSLLEDTPLNISLLISLSCRLL